MNAKLGAIVAVAPLIFACQRSVEMALPEGEPTPEQIVAALLAVADTALASLPECSNDTSGADTLRDDIALYLAQLTAGDNEVSAECWPPEAGGRTCTVTLNHAADELVWSRAYRFQWRGSEVGAISCFTIP